ncbi:MAG: biotin--[acetyl-CoA-carboxylase] ligase [Candidatus Nitrosotenuis sp.]
MLYTSRDKSGIAKVLQFLKAHHREYLSGEDLSEVLKISRVAVWKHIKKIQGLDYKIESKQNLGYRLVDVTDLMLPWEITDGLKTRHLGKNVYYFDSLDSTQNFASSIAKKHGENGTVVIAETQVSGKGRQGRRWISPKGGIWLSVILHPSFDVGKVTLVPFAVAIALSSAIKKTLGAKTELKWPNDVTLNGKKIAGIIIDASIESTRIESLILGVGINFKVDPRQIEKKIKESGNFYGVDTLVDRNNAAKPARLVQAFLEELEKTLALIDAGKTQAILSQWSKRSSTIGRDVSVSHPKGRITGRAVKIDRDGSLVIKHNSQLIKVTAGDVSY